jgi:flagellar hook-associated protein FlgK
METKLNLDEEHRKKLEYIQQRLNQTPERSLLAAIDAYYDQLQQHQADPLARLKQSRFIGSFSGDVDLAEQSEAIVHSLFEDGHDSR